MDDIADSEAEARDALSRGDYRRALALLMGLYKKQLFSHCRYKLRDEALAEDVLQTTFIQAFLDLPRYRGESSLRVWLYAIARHRCLDTLKMKQRQDSHLDYTDTLADVEAEAQSPEEQLQLRAISKHLRGCLSQLQEGVRDAVMLRFMGQMSYEEMAQLLGERAATLQMRVARAMSGLRTCMQAKGVTL